MPAHLLGPHVVGQRVVVRRLLPGRTGPTGGPAFTDLLGVCLSWGDGVAVIEPASGEPVEVPISLIVSGKPVPPRPSVRGRVSAREAESHTAALWFSVETEELGEWTLRHDTVERERPRKRANSCLAMGDPGLPVGEALDYVVAFYTALGRSPHVQLEQNTDIETSIAHAGWTAVPGGDAIFLLAPLAQVRRKLRLPSVSVLLGHSDGPYADAWIPPRTGSWTPGQPPPATCDASLDGDWLGLHGLFVAPEFRRRGFARAVMAPLLDWGAEHGARTAWLHVETDNAPAIALYESLGFVEHHRCRYYTAPQAD